MEHLEEKIAACKTAETLIKRVIERGDRHDAIAVHTLISSLLNLERKFVRCLKKEHQGPFYVVITGYTYWILQLEQRFNLKGLPKIEEE